MSRPKISLKIDGMKFTYRTAAVITDGPRVLLHRTETGGFWSLPGGRVQMGETASQALLRELREATGQTVQVGRLLWVAERFFAKKHRRQHEISLYFAACLPDGSAWCSAPGPFCGLQERPGKPDLRLIFQWFPRDPAALAALPIQPEFLVRGLSDLPPAPRHIFQSDQ